MNHVAVPILMLRGRNKDIILTTSALLLNLHFVRYKFILLNCRPDAPALCAEAADGAAVLLPVRVQGLRRGLAHRPGHDEPTRCVSLQWVSLPTSN